MAKDLVLLKYTGSNGVRLAALCRPVEGMGVVRSVLGGSPGSEEWSQEPDKSAVAIETEGLVMVTSAEDMTLLAFWMAVAAEWLRTHGG